MELGLGTIHRLNLAWMTVFGWVRRFLQTGELLLIYYVTIFLV